MNTHVYFTGTPVCETAIFEITFYKYMYHVYCFDQFNCDSTVKKNV